ncbi:hypothetical protein ISF_07997 [Cordyceps fumosorosea ARSEF 2679]|uniref:Uncharacterized protein n=1 Tax=Cordyceps fumosorosea (strain ARSEF 2679) TaxID=1081104 RepID=A0A167NEX2_CORFA|nr:hypothetical protein ISF_07997 [Cordyceps fumosorosea ARSEF 2679]OAA55486.1 hypothetical protein ISF_07997 [Cordyceps fumosorosea ARSEF 2679]
MEDIGHYLRLALETLCLHLLSINDATTFRVFFVQDAHPGSPAIFSNGLAFIHILLIPEFDIDLHDLWFTYYHAAKNTADKNPILDRLVIQIIQARELGALRRPSPADASVTIEATTSDGVIWTDLPFLVPDDRVLAPGLADDGRKNLLSFTTFLAKRASVGVCQDRLSGIGLALLCDALETPRLLGASGEEEHGEEPARLPQDVTFATLLPAVNAWLSHAGHKIVQLADARWESDACSLGELFRGDPLCGSATPAGFSPERWLFWLKRLEQIAEAAEGAGGKRLGGTVRRSMDNMLLVADERHSAVKQLLHYSPGVIRHEPMVQVFGPS